MKTSQVVLKVLSGALLLPVSSFLCGGPLAASVHKDELARTVRLEEMAKRLGVNPQQILDPATWERSQQTSAQSRLKAALAKRDKNTTPAWHSAELDDVKRQQAVHTLAGFLSGSKDGGSKDASQLPPEVVDLYRKLPKERAPTARKAVSARPERTSRVMEAPARKPGVSLEGWLNANGSGATAQSQNVRILQAAGSPLPAPVPPPADLPQPQDTAATVDADASDPLIVAKAQSLKNDAIEIYRFVHNDIATELYGGSKKGAVGTLREGAGNDADQSSLLIALLRAAGIPARYEIGNVALDLGQLESFSGVAGFNANMNALWSAGLPNQSYSFTDGRGRGLEMTLVWVQAYVPTTAYRGVPRPGTRYDWLPLAPALKRTTKDAVVDLRDAITFDFDAYLRQASNLRPSEAYAAQLRQHIKDNNIRCETLERAEPGRHAVLSDAPFLPSELPVKRTSTTVLTATFPVLERHTVNLAVSSGRTGLLFSYQAPMAELWGKSITVTYEAATPQDQAVLDQYGGIDGTPAYLVKMRTVLRIGGSIVASGGADTLGTPQDLSVNLGSPTSGSQGVLHEITTGGVYAVTLDPGLVPARLIDEHHERMGSASGDQAQAEKLYITGLTYFRELGLARKQMAGLRWHRVYKEVEEALVAREPRVVRYGATAISIARDFFILDAALIRSGQSSVDGDDHRRAEISRLVGLESSFLEHRAGELFYGPRQFSSVKLLQQAYANGVEVLTFGSSNVEDALEQIHWPAEFEERLADAANRGFTVQAPVVGRSEPGLGLLFGFIAVEPTLGTGQYIVAFEAGTANATVNGGVGDGGDGGSGANPSECLSCGGNQTNGSSVNLYTGNYVFQETDLTLPAVGIPVSFTRTYSAQLGWHHNYDQHIVPLVDGSLDWVDETGVPRRFVANGSGIWLPPPRFFQNIEPAAGGGYRMTFPDGMVTNFDNAGRMTSQVDLNGNQLLLTYGPNGLASVTGQGGSTITLLYQSGRLAGLSDSAGRSVGFSINNAGLLTDETDVLGNARHYAYDMAGRLVTKTDRMGNVTKVAYDDRSRLVQVQDPEGGVWSYAYDAKNARTVETDRVGAIRLWELGPHSLPLRIVDPLGNETVNAYDVRGNKTSTQDARGFVTSMSYDANGNILSRTEPTGAVTSYTYGPHARLLTSTDAELRTTTNTYDASGNLLSTLDPDLNLTSYAYSPRGLPLSITRPGGSATTMEYDSRGNVTSMTDSVGGRTGMTYDSAGHLTQMEDPNHHVRTMVVDAAGRMLSMKDPSLAETSFTYDPNGNRLTVKDPENHVTAFTYDKANRLLTTTDALGNVTKQEYDAAGRVTARIDARGFRTETTYDKAGRVTATRDAAGAVTRMTFCADLDQQPCEMMDALGNVTKVVEDQLGREVQRVDPMGNVTGTEYDILGRRTKSIDPAGFVTKFFYDALGRLNEVQDARGGKTKYGYDARGNRVSVEDANQHVTTFAYDLANRLVSETTPVNITEFIYDVAGNRTGKRDGKNQLTSFAYDSNRRLSQITYAGATTPASFTYDERGNKVSEGNGDSHRTMVHDALGRVASVFDQETGRTIDYTYDANGNRTSMHVSPDNETTSYEWDGRNLLVKMTDPEGGVYRFTYDLLGRRTRTLYPNGMRLQNTYDAASRVVSMVYTDKVGAIIESFSYTYDSRGNRTSKIFADGGAEVYGYDELSRLVSVTYPSKRSVAYTYDAVGNRLQMVEGQAEQALATCSGDVDCDGIPDVADNCPGQFNPGQEDSDRPAVPAGLAAGYSFEEVPGTITIRDITGRSDGQTVSAGGVANGRFGRGMNFAGLDGRGYIDVPSTGALESISGAAFSIAVWVRPRNVTNGNAIVGKLGQYQIYWGGQEGSRTISFSGLGPFAYFSNELAMPSEQWTHVAVTYDGAMLRFFINGVAAGENAVADVLPKSTNKLMIGCLPSASGQCNIPSDDDLDELGFWPRALSQAELTVLQTQPLQVSDGKGDVCDPCPASNAASCAPVACFDQDGDGYGVLGASACSGGGGQIDCNDSNRNVHGGAVEVCNGVDDDCDGRVDEACLSGTVTTSYSYNAFNQLLVSGTPVVCAAGDGDCDGVPDASDNCAAQYNPSQKDSDAPNKQPVAVAGALGAWNFDSVVANVAPDLVGSGAATLGSGATTAAGRIPQAGAALNPNGGFATVTALNTNPTTGITVEAWVKVNASGLGTARSIVNESYLPEGNVTFALGVDAEGKLTADFARPGNAFQAPNIGHIEDSVALPTGQWLHVAATYDGTKLRLFRAGDVAAEQTLNGQPLPKGATSWFIGGDGSHFDGLIDDVAIYGRALSASEVGERAKDGDFIGDACDACPADRNPSCAPATCADADGDGFGAQGASACVGGAGNLDCNDSNAAVKPGAAEVMDGIDNNCDGVIDGQWAAGSGLTHYAYDANGNQTVVDSTLAGVTEYVWDARDRLSEVHAPGGVVSKYGYDTANLRVMMDEGGGAANVRRILLDGIEEMAEYVASSGVRAARYDHDVTRVDGLLAQAKVQGSMLVKTQSLTDLLGSISRFVDGLGSAVALYEYDVFGQRTVKVDLVGSKWGFTGRSHEGDRRYHRERYANDSAGWLSADPEGFVDGTDRYIYVQQNPVSFLDWSGLFLAPDVACETAAQKTNLLNAYPTALVALRNVATYFGYHEPYPGGKGYVFDFYQRHVYLMAMLATVQISNGTRSTNKEIIHGYTTYDAGSKRFRIQLDTKIVDGGGDDLVATMLHELVHVGMYSENDKDKFVNVEAYPDADAYRDGRCLPLLERGPNKSCRPGLGTYQDLLTEAAAYKANAIDGRRNLRNLTKE